MNNPTILYYNGTTQPSHICYRNVHERYHNDDGPALIIYYISGKIKANLYYINGVRHRTDGPAVERYCENGSVEVKSFYFDGSIFSSYESLRKFVKIQSIT